MSLLYTYTHFKTKRRRDILLKQHSIVSKPSSYFGSETWVLRHSDRRKKEPTYIRLPSILLGIIFLLLFIVGWDWVHLVLWPLLACCTTADDRRQWMWSNWWNEDWQGKPKYSEKTCPSATLSTTTLTWPDPGLNPACRSGKPVTNRLSYGTALGITLSNIIKQRLVRLSVGCKHSQ
jgi:hypothetical protein